MWLPSTTARDHSMSPAARNCVNNTWWSLSHTPACCHSSSLRQHVKPDPYPSSWGKCIHAIPVCSTNKIPHNACRSGNRFRPGYRNRRSLTGNNGSTSSHSSSETSHGGRFADTDTPLSLTTDADVHSSSDQRSLYLEMSSKRPGRPSSRLPLDIAQTPMRGSLRPSPAGPRVRGLGVSHCFVTPVVGRGRAV
jgi:hypothetical protein